MFMHLAIFDLEHLKVILDPLGTIFLKLGQSLKTAHRRTKQMEIWASGVYVEGMSVILYTCFVKN